MSQLLCSNCGTVNRTSARFCSECGATLPLPPPTSPSAHSLKPGQILQGRYRIETELGRGGFGAVYKAWDNNLNRWCAVKENLQVSKEAERQFSREATVLANISHPNLPRVIDHFFITDQGQYLVMDFVEGEDLASLVERQKTVSTDQALKWIAQVAEALSYLHSLDTPIFHRDIKPANIRITPKGQAMLVDFGLVKISDAHSQTTVGARAITPGYAPPEQYGQGSTDARTDVYALAATLYRILSGNEPPESVQRLSGATIPPLKQANPSAPAYIGKVIEHAMALDPGQRYQTAAEFKNALTEGQTVMVQAPVPQAVPRAASAVPRTIAVESGVVPPAGARSYAPARPVSKPRSRSGMPLLMLGGGAVVAILFVIAALGMGGWLLMSNQTSAKSTQQAGQTSTAVANVNATSTGIVLSTATAEMATIQTATAALQAAQTAQAQSTADFLGPRTLIYGPNSGTLVHDTTDDQIELLEAIINVKNFIVEAIFTNPYPPSFGNWANGLVFNGTDDNQIRFVIGSDTFWEVDLFPPGNAEQKVLKKGNSPIIRTGENETNAIRFIRKGTQGWIYINDQLLADLDLSILTDLSSIWISTGMYGDPVTEYADKSQNYSDFTIWSLP